MSARHAARHPLALPHTRHMAAPLSMLVTEQLRIITLYALCVHAHTLQLALPTRQNRTARAQPARHNAIGLHRSALSAQLPAVEHHRCCATAAIALCQ